MGVLLTTEYKGMTSRVLKNRLMPGSGTHELHIYILLLLLVVLLLSNYVQIYTSI